jgi:hypothetical protein
MTPEKLASVLVWLVVELTLIEPYTLQGQAPAKLRKQSEKVAVAFFRDYENDIIHEAHESKAALLRQPDNLVVDVQAHPGLPDEAADGRAHSFRLCPDGFLGVDVLFPKTGLGTEFAVAGRVAVHADHREPFEIGARLVIQAGAVYHIAQAPLCDIPQGVREESTEIYLDDPSRLRIAFRNFKDVLQELVDSGL